MIFRISLWISLLVGVAGCSSDGSNEKAFAALQTVVTAPFTPAPIIRAPVDKAYVVVGYEGARTPMVQVSAKGVIKNYEGVGGVYMTLSNGQLARLRGLGQEYEALYLDAESPYLGNVLDAARAQKTLTRTMEYWIDEQPKRDRFRCDLATAPRQASLQVVAETCKSVYGPLAFENRYWFDRRGDLVHSRQWFHPKASPLDIEHRTTKKAKSA